MYLQSAYMYIQFENIYMQSANRELFQRKTTFSLVLLNFCLGGWNFFAEGYFL
ncbi:hypothetical protein SAMN02745171_01366 [Porphyromonas circumdentaria]|uniref:Uncharacterized protein n=1 Tax=Porphyromonas circumdentaria TaxID=29524 RepID=A0A1T4P7C3_9PORP|nr:hypothetical protein [Porphyromonas circumdentaria]SJZ87475.1 hypothetical protein SAMN02745171_01366 [Porphyromonas circumdentaria]